MLLSSLPSLVSIDSTPARYELFGLITHLGKSTGSGHYVASILKDKWITFNDHKVILTNTLNHGGRKGMTNQVDLVKMKLLFSINHLLLIGLCFDALFHHSVLSSHVVGFLFAESICGCFSSLYLLLSTSLIQLITFRSPE